MPTNYNCSEGNTNRPTTCNWETNNSRDKRLYNSFSSVKSTTQANTKRFNYTHSTTYASYTAPAIPTFNKIYYTATNNKHANGTYFPTAKATKKLVQDCKRRIPWCSKRTSPGRSLPSQCHGSRADVILFRAKRKVLSSLYRFSWSPKQLNSN